MGLCWRHVINEFLFTIGPGLLLAFSARVRDTRRHAPSPSSSSSLQLSISPSYWSSTRVQLNSHWHRCQPSHSHHRSKPKKTPKKCLCSWHCHHRTLLARCVQCVERERRHLRTSFRQKNSTPTVWFEAATAFLRTRMTKLWRIKVALLSNLPWAMFFVFIDRIRSIFDWADGKGLTLSRAGFFGAPAGRGGGGTKCPPP